MNKEMKAQLQHIIISAGIGLVVCNISLLVVLTEHIGVRPIIKSFLLSALVGIFIGFMAKLAFNYIANKFTENFVMAYIVEGILVFIITIIVTYFLGQKEVFYLILSGTVALVLALFFTHIKVIEFREINKKLKKFQNEE